MHSDSQGFGRVVIWESLTPAITQQAYAMSQYYLNAGGGSHRAAVLGLRTKIDF